VFQELHGPSALLASKYIFVTFGFMRTAAAAATSGAQVYFSHHECLRWHCTRRRLSKLCGFGRISTNFALSDCRPNAHFYYTAHRDGATQSATFLIGQILDYITVALSQHG